MASSAKDILIRRIAASPGAGVGANTGLGSSDIVIPEFPKLPEKLTESSSREFTEAVDRWRAGFQAQFPVPASRVTSTDSSSSVSDQQVSALEDAVAAINSQIKKINSVLSSDINDLQRQIDGISQGGLSESDVQEIIRKARYVHNQNVPSAKWIIRHNLGWYPSVTLIDMSQNVFHGNVTYSDINTCEVSLAGETSGYGYIN